MRCALQVGGHLLTRLRALQQKHSIIGDVRGKGLMLGVELVKDRATKVCEGRRWGGRLHVLVADSCVRTGACAELGGVAPAPMISLVDAAGTRKAHSPYNQG